MVDQRKLILNTQQFIGADPFQVECELMFTEEIREYFSARGITAKSDGLLYIARKIMELTEENPDSRIEIFPRASAWCVVLVTEAQLRR